MRLPTDEVHVWRADLDLEASLVQKLSQTLSGLERERGDRFHFDKDRNRFIVGRGILRAILGRYLRVDPQTLRFHYSSYGKPALVPDHDMEAINFNLSHANGLALYAFTSQRRIGVDLEYIRSGAANEQVAERFFSRSEVIELRTLSGQKRNRAFFDCWTRKESYIKAIGSGLSTPLDQFEVSLKPGEPAALLKVAWDPEETSRWHLTNLHAGRDYPSALCVEGHKWRLRLWQWLGNE